MKQIDFYILGDDSPRDINQMVCRLCEKAFEQEMNVLIYTKSLLQAQQLDDLLWTFKADSFIAHSFVSHNNQLNEIEPDSSFFYPVLISSELSEEMANNKTPNKRLLINLTDETPPFFQQFERMAEIVGKNSDEKEIARNRYRSYRQKDYTLNKYDL